MKRPFSWSLAAVLVSVAALSGCGGSSPGGGDGEPAVSSLNLAVDCAALRSGFVGIGPDPAVAVYEVAGSGPDGKTYTGNFGAAGSVLAIAGLAQGDWAFAVKGKNGAGVTLAAGNTAASIGPEPASGRVTLTRAPGTGGLQLTLIWPGGSIANPVVDGILTGDTPPGINVLFTVDAEAHQATASLSGLAAGAYTLSLQLKDGAAFVSGAVIAVLIVADVTSSGTIQAYVNPTGGISIGIDPQMHAPLGVTFSGNPARLPWGTNLDVTASISPAGEYTCQWFLDGVQIGGDSPILNDLGSGLKLGHYRIDLIVIGQDGIGSAGFEFDVVNETAGGGLQ